MRRNFTYDDVHIDGVERIAEAVAKYDVDRFIHVSSYNADIKSRSEFFRSKVGHPQIRTIYPTEQPLMNATGSGGEGSKDYISRNYHRSTCSNVWVRR